MDANFFELIAVFLVALLYSSVGHGGASGYLAILSCMAVPKQAASTTALILNILVAGLASISFYRAGHLSMRSSWPYLVTSIPAAFAGGMIAVPNNIYEVLLSVCLLAAALRLATPLKDRNVTDSQQALPISFFAGGIIGFISGIVGIGGGIFLSPLIVIAAGTRLKTLPAPLLFLL